MLTIRAAGGLNGIEFEGQKLHAEQLVDKNQRRPNRANQRNPYPGMPGPGRQADFPLRILVQSEMVGAIIGRQGSTIRTITQQSRARVDVHRKENMGSLEKAITIYGNPENCTNACKRILEVMQQEAISTNKGSEISLKILAHNNLIGRIIGKSGNTIKRIMQETDTKITVSSINDINSFNLERIITVKGQIENMSRAEAQISSKLRQSYENDLQAMAPQSLMFPGLPPMAMMSTPGNGMVFNTNMPYSSCPGFSMSKTPATVVPPVFSNDLQETTYLYIPNNAVGAIIGTKGSHIRSIMRFSNASLKIAPLDNDKPAEQQMERKVTIIGSPEGQWKAQYMIFEKMREEGYICGTDDVRLTVEILVASSQVGRIIGKGGQNVRDLQRVTGSIIKLPEHAVAPASGGDEETPVHIIGPFYSVQSAQRRIRAMMMSTNPPPVTKKQKAAKEQSAAAAAAAMSVSVGSGSQAQQQQQLSPQQQQIPQQQLSAQQATQQQQVQQQQPQQQQQSMTSSHLASTFCHKITTIIGLRWELRGKEYLEKDEACVIVANHQSSLDILGMFNIWHVMKKCTVVAKRELFYIWPFGLAAWLAGLIFIDRVRGEKARNILNAVNHRIKNNNIKLWIFPEGTRRNTGEIHTFKKGAFHMAIDEQIPIVPVVFSSYCGFLNDKKRILNSGLVIITTLPPISTVGYTKDDIPQLMECVRNQMSEVFRVSSTEVLQRYKTTKQMPISTLPKTMSALDSPIITSGISNCLNNDEKAEETRHQKTSTKLILNSTYRKEKNV